MGLFYANAHTVSNEVQVLGRPQTLGVLDARIIEANHRNGGGQSLRLEILKPTASLPAGSEIRITHRTKNNSLVVGDIIAGPIRLEPNRGPVRPGGYDSRLKQYAKGVSATGYSLGELKRSHKAPKALSTLQVIRSDLSALIKGAMPGQEGGLAAALVTGDRSGLSDTTREAIRDAGLAHLLAISGLHMGLITAAIFFSVELMIAGIPVLANKIRPAKAAAIAAFIVALGYLALSGAPISAQRAFIMVAIALVAKWMDRPAVSMRSIAIAAFIVLLVEPSAILDAGFQMSFAAATILVLTYERIGEARRLDKGAGKHQFTDKISRWFLGSLNVTLLTQLAVAPVAFYHFQSLSIVALLSNLVAVPIMALVIMPALLLGCILSPLLGFEWIASALSIFLGELLGLAHFMAGMPLATIVGPQPGPTGLAIAFCLGVILIMGHPILRVTRNSFGKPQYSDVQVYVWRVCLLMLMALSVYLDRAHTPFLYLSGTKPGLAYYGDEGFYTSSLRHRSFKMDQWRTNWGLDKVTKPKPVRPSCSEGACFYELPSGERVGVVKDEGTWAQVCETADIMVSPRQWTNLHRSEWSQCKARFIASETIGFDGPVAVWRTAADGSSDSDYLRYRIQASITWPTRPWHPGYREKSGRK